MKTKLQTTMTVIACALMLTACQTTTQSPLITNDIIVDAPTILISIDSDGDGVADELDKCPGTPMNIIVDDRGCPVNVSGGGVLRMELRVFFERDSTEFKVEKYLQEMEMMAEQMRRSPELIAVLSGHTSEPEALQMQVVTSKKTDEIKFDNSWLAHNRVQLVKNRLINEGIAANRIRTFDCADNIQIAPNDTEENASMNQRIYGTVMEAASIYANDNYGSTHLFKHYKQVCEEL